ncbi:MAG: insulinase family protein [Planctomycetes bacterium]|nr:insulinase family protein [Planctomycetota bacterium]MCB9884532.1 insulinase family protein [Planctomycetota bacterium]
MPPKLHSSLLLAALPAILAPTPMRAQTVHEETTATGLRIWDFPDDDADRFSIAVIVGVGARDELRQHAGIAHFLEHVVLQSTKTRPGVFADDELDGRGLDVNGFTSSEATVYHVTGRAAHWRFMVDWLADHVLSPRFDSAEVEGERRTVIEEITTNGPDFHAITYENLLYGDHPLARSIGGNPGTVGAVTVDDLRAFHRRFYHAGNMAVGFAGRVSRDACMQAVSIAFAAAPTGEPVISTAPTPRFGDLWTNRNYAGDQTGSLLLGYHLQCSRPEELTNLLVIEAYLGQRFFAVAREQRHLAYAPSVALTWGRDAQRLAFRCPTSERGNVAPLAEIVADLVGELQKVDPGHLQDAIRRARAGFVCESVDDLVEAMEYAAWVAWHGGAADSFTAAFDQVSAADVAATATRWLRPEQRYSLSTTPLFGTPSSTWALVLVLTIFTAVVLRLYGGPLRAALAARLRRHRRPRGRMLAMRSREPIKTVDAEEVARSIQKFFEEEDRRRGDR